MVADVETGIQVPAAHLLVQLWDSHPSLVSDFVSDGHLPQVLQRLANCAGLDEANFCIQLTQQIWSLTASLSAEPLLVAAIDSLVMVCHSIPSTQAPMQAQQAATLKQQFALDTQVCC